MLNFLRKRQILRMQKAIHRAKMQEFLELHSAIPGDKKTAWKNDQPLNDHLLKDRQKEEVWKSIQSALDEPDNSAHLSASLNKNEHLEVRESNLFRIQFLLPVAVAASVSLVVYNSHRNENRDLNPDQTHEFSQNLKNSSNNQNTAPLFSVEHFRFATFSNGQIVPGTVDKPVKVNETLVFSAATSLKAPATHQRTLYMEFPAGQFQYIGTQHSEQTGQLPLKDASGHLAYTPEQPGRYVFHLVVTFFKDPENKFKNKFDSNAFEAIKKKGQHASLNILIED